MLQEHPSGVRVRASIETVSADQNLSSRSLCQQNDGAPKCEALILYNPALRVDSLPMSGLGWTGIVAMPKYDGLLL